ncbi:MAG: cytidine deaminase [Longimicrobiales bacterium]|nr:cytidine deaminase [Longimicrobiales bacterium]
METTRYDLLTDADRRLMDAAREAMATAYAPYSGVRVGAALDTEEGPITASNVENGAYGATLCAERLAVGRANARGQRSFPAVAVVASGDRLDASRPISPCGPCRQVLHEMARITDTETRILMATPGSDAVTIATLEELLPLPFDPLG